MSVRFDDPNLVSCAGLAPVMALAQRCGLHVLVATVLTLRGPGGVNAGLKVPALVAGMVAGADCIDDMDLLRHGGMRRLFRTSSLHAKATTATLRTQLIDVPARLARSARQLVLHLPQNWPWQTGLDALFTAGNSPPAAAATRP